MGAGMTDIVKLEAYVTGELKAVTIAATESDIPKSVSWLIIVMKLEHGVTEFDVKILKPR
jgi:hypothetical protein